MAKAMLQDNEPLPQWDVALAALVKEEYQKLRQALQIEDFLRLAKEHAIRFDDIMDTVLRMVILGEWVYHDASGNVRPITQEEFDQMYKGGRLQNDDLQAYTGAWTPVDDQLPPAGESENVN